MFDPLWNEMMVRVIVTFQVCQFVFRSNDLISPSILSKLDLESKKFYIASFLKH